MPRLSTAQGVPPSAGSLDTSFGTSGRVLTDFGAYDFASAVALQEEGQIVVAGYSIGGSSDFALARYTRNGRLDATFGSGGTVRTDFGGFELAQAVAIQNDGKVLAAGSSQAGGSADFALARYNRNGVLDKTFGIGGKVLTDLGGFDQANAVAIQQDGRIVAVGYSDAGGSYDFALARYNRNGTRDTTFGVGGTVLTDLGGSLDLASAVAIQHDGKILVAGGSNAGPSGGFALARYNRDGTLDPTFGFGGTVLTDFGFGANAVAIQGDGRIVAAGVSNAGGSYDFALARYNRDGTLDPTFGIGGTLLTDLGGDEGANAVAIQHDGRIVAAGSSVAGGPMGPGNFALARYNRDGSLDETFGAGGSVITAFGGNTGGVNAVVIQENGKIVAAGISDAAGSSDFALARYTR